VYRCTRCGEVVPPHHSAHRVVAEVRRRTYAPRVAPSSKRKARRGKPVEVRTSDGWEAVRTDLVCGRCLPEAEAQLAERLAAIGVGA